MWSVVATAMITLHSVYGWILPILYKYVESVGILLWYIVKYGRLLRQKTFVWFLFRECNFNFVLPLLLLLC